MGRRSQGDLEFASTTHGKALALIKRKGSVELRQRRRRHFQTRPATRCTEGLCLRDETQTQTLCTKIRAHIQFGDGAESALGVKGVTLIKGNKPDCVAMPAACDKDIVFIAIEEVF